METTVKPRKVRHIPRRTGVGARQVIAPRKPKVSRRRFKPSRPSVCGVAHPTIDELVCTGHIRFVQGKPIRHRGDHRARPLVGVLYRWSDEDVAEAAA